MTFPTSPSRAAMGFHQHWGMCTFSVHSGDRPPPSCHLITSSECWVL